MTPSTPERVGSKPSVDEPVLVARGLTKRFPVVRWRGWRPERRVVHALNGVDLALRAGECLGVVGESGSGKTTLVRCLARHETADAGALHLDGVDFLALRGDALRRHRRHLQLVFQDASAALDPRRKVGVSVAEGLEAADGAAAHDRVVELFDDVGLDADLVDRYPHQLSGGQRQRVAIARALAVDPTVLLLDEPVSALDATVRRRILDRVARLRRRLGVAVLFVGHDLGVVGAVAERLAVLYLGRVVETGPTAEILRAPSHPYTAALVAAVPEPVPGTPLASPMHGEVASPTAPPDGCPFHPRCPRAEAVCRQRVPRLEAGENPSGVSVACHHPLDREVDNDDTIGRAGEQSS